MKLSDLLASSPSAGPAGSAGLHLVQTDERTLCNLGWAIADRDPYPDVKTIRGRKSRSVEALFDEMGAALQFPYYFGDNWGALEEVLRDLSWAPRRGFILLFSSAELVLAEANETKAPLLPKTLSRAHAHWRERGVPFHAVFQGATDAATARVSSRLRAAGEAFDELEV
jgi:hypothetical protein